MFKHFRIPKTILLFAVSAVVSINVSFAQAQTHKEFEEHESEFKKMIEEHRRELLRKGDDREARDQALRIANYKANRERLSKQRLEALETLANGQVTGEWKEKGANNMAGRIQNADYEASTGLVYAVSDGGNVWRGNLTGATWTCLNNNLKLKGAHYIKVLPLTSGKRILVGTSDRYVYYSDNEGATWNVPNGIFTGWGWNLKTMVATDANSTVYLLALEWDGQMKVALRRSTDKGANFTLVKTWLIDYGLGEQDKFSLFTPVNTTHDAMYVINKDSVFQVTSAGAFSRLYKHNLPLTNSVRFTGQKSGATVNMYVASNSQIFASSNLGQSWTTLNAPNANNTFGIHSFRVSHTDPNKIYFGDIEAYRGVRSGSNITWTMVNSWGEYYGNMANKLHADIPSFVPITVSGAENFLICTDGGIYKSSDGLNTVQNITLTSMNNAQYYSVYTNRNNLNYIYCGSQDQGIQQATVETNGLLNFTQLMSGDNGRTVSTNSTSFWQTGYGDLYYYPTSTSTAPNWYSLNGVGRLWMPFITEHPTNPNIMYMGGGKTGSSNVAKIYQFSYSSGTGITKTDLAYDFAVPSGCTNIASMAVSKLNANYWYVLTDNGRFFSSSTGSGGFNMNANFYGPTGHYFYGSTVLPSKQTLGTLYVAGDGYNNPGVYKSTDHGANFTPLTNGLPATMILDLAFNANESLVFAATEVGAYVYVVADNTWYPMIGSSGTDQVFWDVEFIDATNTARFATYGRGVWDFKLQSTSNLSPLVSITSPANNATFTAPATVNVTATASDPDGTVSKVEFYQGATKLGEDMVTPYTYSWTNVAAGTYSLTAVAIDNANASTTSTPVTIVVGTPPTSTDICFEGEAGSGQGTFSPFQVASDANASGGQYIWTPNGTGNQSSPPSNSIVTFSFNVPTSATYNIWVRVLAPNSSDNELYIRTDAGSYSTYSPSSSSSWTWRKWTSKSLSAGNHTISLARKEDGLKIDKVLLTKSASTPTGTGCGTSPSPVFASTETVLGMEGETEAVANQLRIAPNPSANVFSLVSSHKAVAFVAVSNVEGKEVFKKSSIPPASAIEFGKDFDMGIYNVLVKYEDGNSESFRVLKVK